MDSELGFGSIRSGQPLSKTRFFVIAALILLIAGTLSFHSAKRETITGDEAVYIAAGYIYVTHGDFNFNAEHPPLAKLLAAIPLLFLSPNLNYDAGRQAEDYKVGDEFVFANTIPAETLILAARLPLILLSLGLGLWIADIARRLAGDIAGLLALCFYAFDPNFLAHGHYVTTDVIIAWTFSLSCVFWFRFWNDRDGNRYWLWTGIACGLAMCSKFTSVVLAPVFLCYALLSPAHNLLWPARLKRLLTVTPKILLVAGLTIMCVYGLQFETVSADVRFQRFFDTTRKSSEIESVPPSLRFLLDQSNPGGRVALWVASNVPIPAYAMLKGLYRVYNHNREGHESFLFGNSSINGFWYYFPITILLKTPVATLLALSSGVYLLLRNRQPSKLMPALELMLPPTLFLLFCMKGNVNIGHRYLLPIYPFFFVFIGISLVRNLRLGIAFATLLSLECAFAFPNFLSYFNFASGGPERGMYRLADSNIDWGQDVPALKAYMEQWKIPEFCMSYSGSANLDYYGIRRRPLSSLSPSDTCTAAISIHNLVTDKNLKWLIECKPHYRVDYGFMIYQISPTSCPVRGLLEQSRPKD